MTPRHCTRHAGRPPINHLCQQPRTHLIDIVSECSSSCTAVAVVALRLQWLCRCIGVAGTFQVATKVWGREVVRVAAVTTTSTVGLLRVAVRMPRPVRRHSTSTTTRARRPKLRDRPSTASTLARDRRGNRSSGARRSRPAARRPKSAGIPRVGAGALQAAYRQRAKSVATLRSHGSVLASRTTQAPATAWQGRLRGEPTVPSSPQLEGGLVPSVMEQAFYEVPGGAGVRMDETIGGLSTVGGSQATVGGLGFTWASSGACSLTALQPTPQQQCFDHAAVSYVQAVKTGATIAVTVGAAYGGQAGYVPVSLTEPASHSTSAPPPKLPARQFSVCANTAISPLCGFRRAQSHGFKRRSKQEEAQFLRMHARRAERRRYSEQQKAERRRRNQHLVDPVRQRQRDRHASWSRMRHNTPVARTSTRCAGESAADQIAKRGVVTLLRAAVAGQRKPVEDPSSPSAATDASEEYDPLAAWRKYAPWKPRQEYEVPICASTGRKPGILMTVEDKLAEVKPLPVFVPNEHGVAPSTLRTRRIR